jgi:hypothetical protein
MFVASRFFLNKLEDSTVCGSLTDVVFSLADDVVFFFELPMMLSVTQQRP